MSTQMSLLALAALALSAAPLAAQGRSSVSPARIDAAVTAPALSRGALRTFLASDEAKKVARGLGTSAAALDAHVATMDQAALDRFGREHQLTDKALAGGRDTIIISTTAVIIGLLILILITD